MGSLQSQLEAADLTLSASSRLAPTHEVLVAPERTPEDGASSLSLLSVCAAMATFERIHVGTDHQDDCLYRGGPGGFTGDYVEYQVRDHVVQPLIAAQSSHKTLGCRSDCNSPLQS